MAWTKIEANSLLAIDQEVGNHHFSPSAYEIIRRVIYETGDFDYLSHLHFSDRALSAGAAALAARTAIVVDVPLIQTAIASVAQNCFANPIYSPHEDHRSYTLPVLAKRYPEAIFVIGQEQRGLSSFLDLLHKEEIKPALAVITSPKLIERDEIEARLEAVTIPHIRVIGRKGNASVAVGILNGLIDLAWQVYTQSEMSTSSL
jgi:precorrin-8X/cobalt-precorrin-8 methylmutase